MAESDTNMSGETDRTSGEYHYKNGYTQQIYSDAHYVPADDNPVPPRYYAPPDRPVKPTKEKKLPCLTVPGLVALCLTCALLGGLCGAAAMYSSSNAKFDRMQSTLEALGSRLEAAEEAQLPQAGSAVASSGLKLSEIYDSACQQAVGITTSVTFTNFFGQTSSSAVSGSGFILSDDGYILTNYHVIEYAYEYGYEVSVMLHDGSRYKAEIIGVEEYNDIAVLKIDAFGLRAATLGNSGELAVGDEVYAVGNPLGELEFSMTAGHVSALDRLIATSESGDAINMFQIDAAVNSGNSGGPVYDSAGRVIGVVTAKYSSTGVEGLGFAIPINDAAAIANDLISNGYVTGKAELGVECDERYSSLYSRWYNLPDGAYVKSVAKGSCAETAGFQKGDIITAVDGVAVNDYTQLGRAIRGYSAGDSATISVYREGNCLDLSVVFDEATKTAKSMSLAG